MVDLFPNGSVAQADRKDVIRPGNAKRADLRHSGRRFMANHKVVTTDAEMNRALERAKTLRESLMVNAALFVEMSASSYE
jgi:hypothetical protein